MFFPFGACQIVGKPQPRAPVLTSPFGAVSEGRIPDRGFAWPNSCSWGRGRQTRHIEIVIDLRTK
jgi:hypothetical protein